MGKNDLNRLLLVSTLLLSVSTLALALVAVKQHRQAPTIREAGVSVNAAFKRTPDTSAAPVGDTIRREPDRGKRLRDEERQIYKDEIHRLKSQLAAIQTELYSSVDEATENTERSAESSFNEMLADYADAMKDPEVRAFRRSELKKQMANTYHSLFKELELSTGDLEDFKELLVEQSMARKDIGLEMGSTTSLDSRKEGAARIEALGEEYDGKILAALGEYNYEVYRQWQETLYDRSQVDYYKQSLSEIDQIDEEQEYDLIGAMHEERTGFASSTHVDQEQPFDPSQITEEDITNEMDDLAQLHANYIVRAQDILTEPQMVQFLETLEQQRSMVERTSRMMMLMNAAHDNVEEAVE